MYPYLCACLRPPCLCTGHLRPPPATAPWPLGRPLSAAPFPAAARLRHTDPLLKRPPRFRARPAAVPVPCASTSPPAAPYLLPPASLPFAPGVIFACSATLCCLSPASHAAGLPCLLSSSLSFNSFLSFLFVCLLARRLPLTHLPASYSLCCKKHHAPSPRRATPGARLACSTATEAGAGLRVRQRAVDDRPVTVQLASHKPRHPA